MTIKAKQSLRGSVSAPAALQGRISTPDIIKGKDGVTFTPVMDDEGNLSWTNDGGLENPPTVNIKGHTPVKGVDYFTEEEKAELVNSVLTTLPDASDTSF